MIHAGLREASEGGSARGATKISLTRRVGSAWDWGGQQNIVKTKQFYGMARPPSGVVGSPGNQEEEGMDISVLGVDLGKNVCSVVGLDASGSVVMRREVRRETLIALAEKLSPCVVGMEACCGAHDLGRVFAAHGHEVRLIARICSALRQGAEERRSRR